MNKGRIGILSSKKTRAFSTLGIKIMPCTKMSKSMLKFQRVIENTGGMETNSYAFDNFKIWMELRHSKLLKYLLEVD